VHYLHRYHGVVAPVALIAPFARMTRSTNRSTLYHSDHRMPATERDRRPAGQRVPTPAAMRTHRVGIITRTGSCDHPSTFLEGAEGTLGLPTSRSRDTCPNVHADCSHLYKSRRF
jgi:hypothetical protein